MTLPPIYGLVFQIHFQVDLVVFVRLYVVLLEFWNPLWLVIDLYHMKEIYCLETIPSVQEDYRGSDS